MRYISIIFLLLSTTGRSQILQGTVTDAGTGKPLSPVTVFNVFTMQSTSTNDSGRYAIPAKAGDIISFSYIGYKTMEKTRPAGTTPSLNIALEQTDFELKEFTLRPGHLTQYQMDSAERVAIYHFPLSREHPSPFVSPISAIAELFSREARRTYRFQKVFAAGEIEKFVDTRYTPELVTKLTGLTGDSIGHFMYANPMPYDFARVATDLEIKMWIRSSYREWMKTATVDSVIKPD